MRTLPDRALLDRIVRGRAWIPLLGVLLAGIVAMQVEELKLGASIGHWIERGNALQSRNELLRANVASLADDQRIERLAAGMGMVMPVPSAVGFLAAQPGAAGQALANIKAPNAASFAAAVAAAAGPSAPAGASATSASAAGASTAAANTPSAPASTTGSVVGG